MSRIFLREKIVKDTAPIGQKSQNIFFFSVLNSFEVTFGAILRHEYIIKWH